MSMVKSPHPRIASGASSCPVSMGERKSAVAALVELLHLEYFRLISSKYPDASSSLMKRASTKPSGLALGTSGRVRESRFIIDFTTSTYGKGLEDKFSR